MKRTYFLISTLLLVATLSLSDRGLAQNYVHYATLTGHTGTVRSIAYSPDGDILASGTGDGKIYLWDVHMGKLQHILMGNEGNIEIEIIVYSPDGRTLASGSSDGAISLWDVQTNQLLKTFIGHKDIVKSLAFSKDSYVLASGSGDKTIRLWNPRTGKLVHTLAGHTEPVMSIAYSPDGLTFASGAFDESKIRLWTWTGQLVRTIGTSELLRGVGPGQNGVMSVAYSPDGNILASGAYDGTIRLWDLHTGKLLFTLTGHTFSVKNIAYSPDGRLLASVGWDKTVRLWDAFSGVHLQTLTGHTFWVSSVAYSPDGRTLASGSYDETIRLWRVSTPQSKNINPSTPRKFSADQVYDNAIRSVMWIVNPGIGEGSGVLIDKKSKLAITNAHVPGEQNTVDIYFPAPDEKGELIKDRNFYLTSSGVLKRLGYYSKGHVVARDKETDIAIIRLDGLPETAREIDWSFTVPATNSGDIVYILGNPGGQDLWRWTLGEYLKDHGDFLHIQSDVFGGNSGGPVLNKQGVLLGIVARSDRHMNALAIPVRDINQLLSESRLEHSRSLR